MLVGGYGRDGAKNVNRRATESACVHESKGMKDGHKVPESEYQFRLEYRSNICVDIDI